MSPGKKLSVPPPAAPMTSDRSLARLARGRLPCYPVDVELDRPVRGVVRADRWSMR